MSGRQPDRRRRASPLARAPTPYPFAGPVYLTGPYNGAPFGLSIVVPAVAGPFNLGNVVTRATINVDPNTARVAATSSLPTIVKGIPLRMRHITVNINKQGFLRNPTNCGKLATESTLSGLPPRRRGERHAEPLDAVPGSQLQRARVQAHVQGASGANTSKANGASLETTLNIPTGEANIKSVLVQLPKQLPSRLTTLQKACPEATFASEPVPLPDRLVRGRRARQHADAAGQIDRAGDPRLARRRGRSRTSTWCSKANGVRVILVGNTDIKKGITTTNFATTPDVPVSSITVNLPIGSHSRARRRTATCARASS